jgi:hypothetical protein
MTYTLIFWYKKNLFIGFDLLNLYLHSKFKDMTKSQKNTYWVLFFLSLALSVGVYFFLPSMVSLMVVPVVTTFTKALDLI